jgi:hypothetical protein
MPFPQALWGIFAWWHRYLFVSLPQFFILQVMTDYEYIIKQAKKLYYTQWSEEELRKCVDMLPALEREELVSLCHCKWIKKVMKAQNYLFSYARTKIQ